MKFPFDFGIKLVFRLVIPGFLLSIGLLPLLNIVLDFTGRSNKLEFAFVLLVILTGWAITLADMGIYMFLEGRRFWPTRVKGFFRGLEERRLTDLIKKTKHSDDQIVREAYFDLRNFALNDTDEYEAFWPSRLGNLIGAFESYSLKTYGIDPIFYWPRIWLSLDKDTREEIDNSQALADSAAYATFALMLTGLIWLVYVLVRVFLLTATNFPSLLSAQSSYLIVIGKHLPPIKLLCLLSGIFLLAAFVLYRVSLRLHAQFGEIFKAVFDVYRGKISVDEIIQVVEALEKSQSVSASASPGTKDRYRVAARYLWYRRYRCPKPQCNALLKLSEIKSHTC